MLVYLKLFFLCNIKGKDQLV